MAIWLVSLNIVISCPTTFEVVGTVPFKKYSKRETHPGLLGSPDGIAPPVSAQIVAPTTSSGCKGHECPSSSGSYSPFSLLFNAYLITAFQIGDAPETPDTAPPIGELSLFPTQTTTTICLVYPIVQLSR